MSDRLEAIKERHKYGYLHSEELLRCDDWAWLIAELEMTRRSLKVMIRQQERHGPSVEGLTS